MLNTRKIIGQAGIDYLRASEYYKNAEDKDVPPMKWIGKGLTSLGLQHGTPALDSDFVNLCRGFHPNGEALLQNSGNEERVIGIDWNFNADKSVSAMMAIETPERRDAIIRIHQESVQKCIGYLENFAQVRTGKHSTEYSKPQGLLCAQVTHFTNRNVDEDLHDHILILNVAPTEDGKFNALDQEWMLKQHSAVSALYRSEMAFRLKKELGYGITQIRPQEDDEFNREKGYTYYTLTGFTDEWRKATSTRREDILAFQKENGGSKQQASLATRKEKDEPPFTECLEKWQQRHSELVKKGVAHEAHTLHHQADSIETISDDDMYRLFDNTNNAVSRQAEILARVAMENVGRLSFDECLNETQRLLDKGLNEGWLHTNRQPKGQSQNYKKDSGATKEERYSTQAEVFRERDGMARAMRRKDEQEGRVPSSIVDKAIEDFNAKAGFSLSDEQVKACRHITSETGGYAVVRGSAGTGKTTLMNASVEAWKANGQEVIGVAIAWDASKNLESEINVPCYSTQSLIKQLNDGTITLKKNSVVLLDEAGMAGSKTIHHLMTKADEAGAKIVFIGDQKQLQPIEAGGIFRLIQKSIGETQLTDIRRQKSIEDLQTAKAFYAEPREAYKRMVKNNQITKTDDSKQALDTLVSDYMKSSSHPKDKLVLVGTHKEARLVSNNIREEMKQLGRIEKENFTFKAMTGRFKETIDLSKGERIRFTKKDTKLNVYNGTKGTILAISDNGDCSVQIESNIAKQNGRIVNFNLNTFNNVNYDWAVTVHKSQGQSKKEVFQLANAQMADFHSSMVGFTRMKEKFMLYGSNDDINTYEKRIGLERLKENAIDTLNKPQKSVEKKTFKEAVNAFIESELQKIRSLFQPKQQTQPVQQKSREKDKGLSR